MELCAAQSLTVHDSSFLNNRAAGAGALGGAIYTSGSAEVVNSSFYGSVLGGGETPIYNHGSDITTGGSLSVLNSTFVQTNGGSLESAGGGVIRNSLFSTFSATSCFGSLSGDSNVHAQGDTSCPGMSGVASGWLVTDVDYYNQHVPVFPLLPGTNAARGAGTTCPAYDAIGFPRPANGCDLGALQTQTIATSTVIETIPSATTVGIVTLRASVTSTSGVVPDGHGVVHVRRRCARAVRRGIHRWHHRDR